MADLDQLQDVRVQVLISEQTEIGQFNDAIYLTPEELAALSEEQISDMKKARADAWVASVKAASSMERPEPTKADIQAQIDATKAELAELQAALKTAK